MVFFLIIAIIVVLIIVLVVLLKAFYLEVPQSCAYILNDTKVIFAPTIVLPNVQKKLIKMLPVHIKMEYVGNNALLTQDGLLIDLIATYSLCVEGTSESVLAVANTVGAEYASDKEAVAKEFKGKFKTVIEAVVSQYPFDVLDKDQGKLRKALVKQTQVVLKGYLLDYLSIDRLDITPLKGLTSTLADQQHQAKSDWDSRKRVMLEQRLEQAVSQQLALSLEVKRLIDSYNKVIKEKIQSMLAARD